MRKNTNVRRFVLAISTLAMLLVSAVCYGADSDYYTERQVYSSRPDPDREMPFGHVGVTGLMVRIHRDVTLKVEKIVPGSPADGKFQKGEIITGVNGVALKGRNPFVALGNALTQAEATDGRMVFDVAFRRRHDRQRKETVRIPVLGSYSKTWPLDCAKSKKIIAQAAEILRRQEQVRTRTGGIPGALACLFLLSTGDDQYLPRVKEYFDGFPKDVKGIGDHTWNNGYNGIACAEYYLRTGDRSVLPILQHYCDDAKKRQKFGCGWAHWGTGIAPGYVAGGLMNPAGAQVLTTLLLAKECGVEVDEETLLGSLRYFYRFAGRGTVPYGDHRGEGGLGSNGKDGMIAAAMQIAAGARGDVTIYKEARDYLAMSMITSYPLLVQGHGDEGRGDGIWRSIIPAYLMRGPTRPLPPAMDRLTWWHDLSREPGGSMGIGTLAWETGDRLVRSGRRALLHRAAEDAAHHRCAPLEIRAGLHPARAPLGDEGRPGVPFDRPPPEVLRTTARTNRPTSRSMPSAAPTTSRRTTSRASREAILKNVYHKRYMIRAQAAKALREIGAFDELEKLLRDPDPRVRRAALDGLIDYNYWFGIGRDRSRRRSSRPPCWRDQEDALGPRGILVGGRRRADGAEVRAGRGHQACKSLIMPWTRHADWWLRESAFAALSGLERDEAHYLEVLPTMLEMMTAEYHTQPREDAGHFKGALKSKKTTSPAGKLIIAGLRKAVGTSEVKTGQRSPEGAYNIAQAAKACLQDDPASAAAIALMIRERFEVFSTGDLIKLVATPNSSRENPPYGLYSTLDRLTPSSARS